MGRNLLWALATAAAIGTIYALRGGNPWILLQPFDLAMIVATMVGFSAASGHLRTWPRIVQDLRRAGAFRGMGAPASEEATPVGVDHRRRVFDALNTAETAALVGGFVAALLGLLHLCGDVTDTPQVLGHLAGVALVPLVIGLLVAYGLVAPIGARLAVFYHAGGDPRTDQGSGDCSP